MKKIVLFFGKGIFESITKISPKLSASLLYFLKLKKYPNLKNPRNFAEQLTWLKLYKYANDPLVSKLADKYAVREYVKARGHENILTKLYGVYDNASAILFDDLPDKFALKGTHGCGYNIIVDDKNTLDYKSVRKKAAKWLRSTYGTATTELHYSHIPSRLIIEENICEQNGKMPTDYKIFCFHGVPQFIQVITNRKNGRYTPSYYDTNWNRLSYESKKYLQSPDVVKPKKLKQMLAIAQDLSAQFPFVRVDLYNEKDRVIFGELTFTPACGHPQSFSQEALNLIGEHLNITAQRSAKPSLQVLISTMNRKNIKSLARAMNVTNYVIVNQITKEIRPPKDIEEDNVRIISVKEKGLSKSRNTAIKNSTADICAVADDDLKYVDKYEDIIRDGYAKYPDADIIAFDVDYSDPTKNKKPLKEGRVGLLYSMKISSVRITFSRKSIVDSGVLFDESFGAGTSNFMGEENIFLAQCIRKGLKVYSVPQKIATLQESESSWFRGLTPDYFIVRGKVFRKISPILGIPLCIRFAIRKYNRYKTTMSLTKAILYMTKGYYAKK